MSKKVIHPKIDPYKISLKQKYEVDYVVAKFKKEGITTYKEEIKNAIKVVGHGRRAVYAFIRSCHN